MCTQIDHMSIAIKRIGKACLLPVDPSIGRAKPGSANLLKGLVRTWTVWLRGRTGEEVAGRRWAVLLVKLVMDLVA